ncbi:GerMN domain-containing protein [Actinoplanes sp. ATCC 53533]|uniref:GerMN domain-containing protein n=1 Tax=Actinoplanes sp. ATCC 53533 TaxID=1288362 RepID=UPI000F7B9295|nr:GerMN domain-containing protein [Actinoplanes sp. ATCC 53533]
MTRSGRGLPALLTACLLTGACGVPVDGSPRDLDRPRPAAGSSTPAPGGLGSALERLYLVRDGSLVRAVRRVPVPPTPQRMLADLLAGPTRAEQQDGLSSALSTMRIDGMTVIQRRATVTISEPPDQAARSDEILAYGQIVCTLTSQGAEVGTVSFTSAGRPLGVPRGDGSLSTQPLTIADYAGLLDP